MGRTDEVDVDPVRLGSGAWHGDHVVDVPLPRHWDVEVYWPATPPEVSDEEILQCLRRPVGQGALRDLAVGSARPVILVDDLTRPTPAARVMPFVLAELHAAGIPNESVTIVMATGTHGAPPEGREAFVKKVGELAASRCRLTIHNHLADVVPLGRTSVGTPVVVNRHVAAADCLIGIGGIYPQHTTFFGGGSKLVLGVLGERSIAHLHYRHWRPDGLYALENDFRRDLDEVAAMVRLKTSISLHVDAYRRPVRVAAGDPTEFYAEQARFSRDTFRAPPPGNADVVIANAYPIDLNLTFAHSKGSIPLKHAPVAASRVLVAACPEGNGNHGLFPLVNVPRRYYRIQWLRRQLIARAELRGKISSGLRQRLPRPSRDGRRSSQPVLTPAPVQRQVHLLRPAAGPPLELAAAGVTLSESWTQLIARVEHEQGRRGLRAVVYPCAPLQTLAFAHDDSVAREPLLHEQLS